MPKRPTFSLIGTALGAVLLSGAWSASAQLVDVGKPMVGFFATGPAGLNIEGHAASLSVTDREKAIEIDVPVNTLETGIGLRDEHLRDYIHAKDHPSAQLVVPRSALSFPADGKQGGGKATGELSLNGKKHSLPFSYQARRVGSQYQVQALATIDIRDHGIEVPCYLKICVQPEVKIKVKFQIEDR